MTSRSKPTTLINGDQPPVVRGDWLENIGPKVGDVSVKVAEEYLESERTAKMLDPPGSAKAVARAARKAHGMAVGLSHSGLTLKALCEITAPLCPRDSHNNATSAAAVERVIRGLLKLPTILTPESDE